MNSELMDEKTLIKLQKVMLEILDEFVRICDKNNLDYFLIGGTLLGAVRHKGFIPWDDDIDVAMPRLDYEKFLKIATKELNELYEIDNFITNKNYYLNFTKIRKKNTLFVQDFQKKYDGPKGIWLDIFPLDSLDNDNNIEKNRRIKIVKVLRSFAHYRNGFFLNKNNILIKKVIGMVLKPIKAGEMMKLADKLMKKQNNNSKFFVNIASQHNIRKQTIEKSKYYPIVKLNFCGNLYSCPNNYDFILNRIYGDYMKLPPKEKQVTHRPIKLNFDINNPL